MDKITEARTRWIKHVHEEARIKGITHKQIAKKLDMKPSNVSKMLSGKHNITLDNYLRLADAIGFKI